MPRNVAIILARGGSKGIPRKNIREFCGRPLIAWTIEHAALADNVDEVWVSSDDDEILAIAKQLGAMPLHRPADLAGDLSSSEVAWLHAIDELEKNADPITKVVALQATSPVRHATDIDGALEVFTSYELDSLFSACPLDDILMWSRNGDCFESLNYDYRRRGRRQDRDAQYVENGSFYVFKPSVLREHDNRLGGKIGTFEMPLWKCFEIDGPDDWEFCELLMRHYIIAQ